MYVSVFQRGRKQELLLWSYRCYSVENRERKHTYCRHSVFFPWRYNKIKHFPLHTQFLFVWKRGKALVQSKGVDIFPCWQRPGLHPVPWGFPASLPSGNGMPHWLQILNFCAESPVGAGVTNGFYLLPKNTTPLSTPPILPNLAPRSTETESCPKAPSVSASFYFGPCLYIC